MPYLLTEGCRDPSYRHIFVIDYTFYGHLERKPCFPSNLWVTMCPHFLKPFVQLPYVLDIIAHA